MSAIESKNYEKCVHCNSWLSYSCDVSDSQIIVNAWCPNCGLHHMGGVDEITVMESDLEEARSNGKVS